ncbi:MAG: DUF1987 domain-containing protein [Bacteroidales bacterium]|nr:DUF1987 domain-containing protein [Bacteroidales bacterium]
MEKFIREETEDTPEIIFDPESGIFKISKISVPENALDFYRPVLDWIKQYAEEPNVQTQFDFDLEYVNTASSKQVIQVILLLQKVAEKGDVRVRWFYESIDEDMKALGARYKKLVNVPFELIEIDE